MTHPPLFIPNPQYRKVTLMVLAGMGMAIFFLPMHFIFLITAFCLVWMIAVDAMSRKTSLALSMAIGSLIPILVIFSLSAITATLISKPEIIFYCLVFLLMTSFSWTHMIYFKRIHGSVLSLALGFFILTVSACLIKLAQESTLSLISIIHIIMILTMPFSMTLAQCLMAEDFFKEEKTTLDEKRLVIFSSFFIMILDIMFFEIILRHHGVDMTRNLKIFCCGFGLVLAATPFILSSPLWVSLGEKLLFLQSRGMILTSLIKQAIMNDSQYIILDISQSRLSHPLRARTLTVHSSVMTEFSDSSRNWLGCEEAMIQFSPMSAHQKFATIKTLDNQSIHSIENALCELKRDKPTPK